MMRVDFVLLLIIRTDPGRMVGLWLISLYLYFRYKINKASHEAQEHFPPIHNEKCSWNSICRGIDVGHLYARTTSRISGKCVMRSNNPSNATLP